MRTHRFKQVSVNECSLDELRAYCGTLPEQHWLECEDDKQVYRLSINWDSLRELEESGDLVVLISHDEGEVIGYSVTVLCAPIHADMAFAGVNHALFVQKDHRSGGLGARLILATESAVRQRGATAMTWHAKPASAMDSVMARMGYDVRHTSYSSRL